MNSLNRCLDLLSPIFSQRWLQMSLTLVVFTALLYLVMALYLTGEFFFALVFLLATAASAYVIFNKRLYAYRYIYPALLGIAFFIVLPLVYTVGIAFTNYSASNLLSYERAQQVLLKRSFLDEDSRFAYSLYAEGDDYRISLATPDGTLSSEPFDLSQPSTQRLHLAAAPEQPALNIKSLIQLKNELDQVQLQLPDERIVQRASLREFAAISPRYSRLDDGQLQDNEFGLVLTPNFDEGFYYDQQGNKVTPGFTVGVGFDNFTRVLTDQNIQKPFVQIFIWTLLFASLSVLFTLIVGYTLASILEWELIKGKTFYRTLLILPYAVPAFISILVFRGLFNQNFGEINFILEALFGVQPDWFTNPFFAKTMILIVNTWLGYPYIMLLCMGLLKSIPTDLYEAAAMDGASALQKARKVVLPLLMPPLMPLLIASFAFNFNNFVLIALLTQGGPDIIGATTPAGTTDILVSYTWRIAFQGENQDFALASAIAVVIFALVSLFSFINMKLSKVEV